MLNQAGLASLIASKAARSLAVAGGRRLVDFGLRRSQGADAGPVAARSSYLTGFAGTSNVLAGMRYGIPLYGTMAHSYVMAHEQEREAFDSYVKVFPRLSTLLVDTYEYAARRRISSHGGAGVARERGQASKASGSTAATCSS